MQLKDAIELRKRWHGGDCSHPDLDKEYDLGTATGDYACTRCGQTGWGSDWNEKEHKNKNDDRSNQKSKS